MQIEALNFRTLEWVKTISQEFGTPLFVYSQQEIEKNADAALSFPNPFGLTVRYAMKASPSSSILKCFLKKGIHIDASSIHEVKRALLSGYTPSERILTSKEFSPQIKDLIEKVVFNNACSLHQLNEYAKDVLGFRSFYPC